MPELPEVQTVVEDLRKKVSGRRIVDVWFDASKIIKKPQLAKFQRDIKGLKISDIRRRGKNILIYLTSDQGQITNDFLLLVHQKMTGHLLYGRWGFKKVE